MIRVLGIGSFGKVYLVENRNTGEVFAMKSTRKDKIVDYEQIESAKLEKFITHETDHPFIVKMYYIF